MDSYQIAVVFVLVAAIALVFAVRQTPRTRR
jgi:hypothetical protein